jgi:hypothetical protein
VILHRQVAGGARVKGEQAPEALLTDAQALKVGGVDLTVVKAAVGALVVEQQRVDRRLGPAAGDRGEGPLPAAHDEQVVVD